MISKCRTASFSEYAQRRKQWKKVTFCLLVWWQSYTWLDFVILQNVILQKPYILPLSLKFEKHNRKGPQILLWSFKWDIDRNIPVLAVKLRHSSLFPAPTPKQHFNGPHLCVSLSKNAHLIFFKKHNFSQESSFYWIPLFLVFVFSCHVLCSYCFWLNIT